MQENIDMKETTAVDEDLCHHGILGMRWGIRRNKKQLARDPESKKIAKKSRKADDESDEKKKRKALEDMSDEELKTATNRKRLMNDYLNADASYRKAQADYAESTKSRGRKLAEQCLENMAKTLSTKGVELAVNIGSKKVKEMLGIDDDDRSPLQKLKDQRDEAQYRSELEKYKDPDTSKNYDNLIKKVQYETSRANFDKREEDIKKREEELKKREEELKKRK